jgi:hypothetical protein
VETSTGGCEVCIGNGDYDVGPEFHDANVVKARKAHRCYECRRTITAGSYYESVVGKWDGDFLTFKTCLDCMNIRDGLTCGSGFTYGELWENISEVFDEINTGCLVKIETASAKAYLVHRWRKWKGLEDHNSTVEQSTSEQVANSGEAKT